MSGTTQWRIGLGALLMVFSAAATAQNAMTTEPTNLYAGPDDEYPVVAEVDSNTPIEVMGCLDDWSWCDVAVGDSRGWMYSPVISYRYEGNYVPFYSYAPSLGVAVVPFSVDVYWNRYYYNRPWYPRREEWAHRTFQHRRPPGPPPSAARPGDHPMRLGSAEPPRREAAPVPRPDVDRRDIQRHDDAPRPPEARPEPRAAVPPRLETRPEPRAPLPARPDSRPEQHAAPPTAAPPAAAPRPAPPPASAVGRIAAPPAREERPQRAAPPSRDGGDRPR